MRLTLQPHPDAPPGPLSGIEAEVSRDGAVLTLRFIARGRVADLVLPPAGAHERRDELWKHTCFEAFFGLREGDYVELNLAPSTQWAAYRFTGYRAGLNQAAVSMPRIETRNDDDTLELTAAIDLGRELVFDKPLRLGLSAVIEDKAGAKTYWALNHAPGKPDFHHPDAFASELS